MINACHNLFTPYRIKVKCDELEQENIQLLRLTANLGNSVAIRGYVV